MLWETQRQPFHTYSLMLNFSPHLSRKREIGQSGRSLSLVTPLIIPRSNVNYRPNLAPHLQGPHKQGTEAFSPLPYFSWFPHGPSGAILQPCLGNWKESAHEVEWLTLHFTNLQNGGDSDKKRDAVCFSCEVLTGSFHSPLLAWALCYLSLIFFSLDRHSWRHLQLQCCVRVFMKEPKKHPLLSCCTVLSYDKHNLLARDILSCCLLFIMSLMGLSYLDPPVQVLWSLMLSREEQKPGEDSQWLPTQSNSDFV